ncbi:MAG: hypothetical protein Unbinned1322contig1000_62 [Prokaryotic dsDNA virus sp.]|nr:hypothetical protein [Aequorivita sp.]QDP57318.1 MAG: hypothetical protein Unbinned1322contig1000_62 [Prokaryotic dsDNA virus sp.]|tara:strand:+ start:3582 stop:3863 length:282 start_codon:yes stop_codon:yes gene_type:complete
MAKRKVKVKVKKKGRKPSSIETESDSELASLIADNERNGKKFKKAKTVGKRMSSAVSRTQNNHDIIKNVEKGLTDKEKAARKKQIKRKIKKKK